MFTKKELLLVSVTLVLTTLILSSSGKANAQSAKLCGYFKDEGNYYLSFQPYNQRPSIVTNYTVDDVKELFGIHNVETETLPIEISDPSFNRSGVLTGYSSARRVSQCATLFPTAPVKSNSRQIWFTIKGDTSKIYSLTINGVNQNNQLKTRTWSWKNGTELAITTDWWWKDYVALDFTFYTTKKQDGRCVIDSLKLTRGLDYTSVQYDPVKRTCTGDAGSATSIRALDLLAYRYLHEDEIPGFEQVISANNAFRCGERFLKDLRNPTVSKIVITTAVCGSSEKIDAVIDLLIKIGARHNKDVSRGDAPTAAEPILNLNQTSNCREGPSTAYEVVYSYLKGSTLEIIGKYGSAWWQVPHNMPEKTRKTSCWIYGAGNKVTGDTSKVPTVQTSSLPPTEAPSQDDQSASMPVYSFSTDQVIGSITCSEASLYEWSRYEEAPLPFYFSDELEKLFPDAVPIENTAGIRIGVYESDAKAICGW